MEAAASGGVAFAADQEGGFIFPAFLPSFDGAAALVKLIALLGRSGESLAQVASRVPELPIMHTEVETPFEQKGLVMRTLMEQLAEEEGELVLVDGIKVLTPTGWVLVVPDPEEPTTHVWAEGPTGPTRSGSHRGTSSRVAGTRSDRPLASPPMNIPDDLRYSAEHEWVRVDGSRVPRRDHRLRPGRARRHRLRRAPGRRDRGGGRRKSGRGGVDQVGLGDLRAGGRDHHRRQRCALGQRPSGSTRIPTGRGGSASWSWPTVAASRPAGRRRLRRSDRRLSTLLATRPRPGKRDRGVEYRGCRVL